MNCRYLIALVSVLAVFSLCKGDQPGIKFANYEFDNCTGELNSVYLRTIIPTCSALPGTTGGGYEILVSNGTFVDYSLCGDSACTDCITVNLPINTCYNGTVHSEVTIPTNYGQTSLPDTSNKVFEVAFKGLTCSNNDLWSIAYTVPTCYEGDRYEGINNGTIYSIQYYEYQTCNSTGFTVYQCNTSDCNPSGCTVNNDAFSTGGDYFRSVGTCQDYDNRAVALYCAGTSSYYQGGSATTVSVTSTTSQYSSASSIAAVVTLSLVLSLVA